MNATGFVLAAVGVIVVVEAARGMGRLTGVQAVPAASGGGGGGGGSGGSSGPAAATVPTGGLGGFAGGAAQSAFGAVGSGVTPAPMPQQPSTPVPQASSGIPAGQGTLAGCLQMAAAAGFDQGGAQTVCHIAGNESGYGSDNRCTCAYTASGTFYHDAECVARGLTGHCGPFQLAQDNPVFAGVMEQCGNDLACLLRWMYSYTRGGVCFADWGPDVGQNYGYCQHG